MSTQPIGSAVKDVHTTYRVDPREWTEGDKPYLQKPEASSPN